MADKAAHRFGPADKPAEPAADQPKEVGIKPSDLAEAPPNKFALLGKFPVQDLKRLIPFLPKEAEDLKHILDRERYVPERDPKLDELLKALKSTPEDKYFDVASKVIPTNIHAYSKYMDSLPIDQVHEARAVYRKMMLPSNALKPAEPVATVSSPADELQVRRSVDGKFMDDIFEAPDRTQAALAFKAVPEVRRFQWFTKMLELLPARHLEPAMPDIEKCLEAEHDTKPEYFTVRPCEKHHQAVSAFHDMAYRTFAVECKHEYRDFKAHMVKSPDYEKAASSWKLLSHCFHVQTILKLRPVISLNDPDRKRPSLDLHAILGEPKQKY